MSYYSYVDFSKFDHDFEKAEAVIGHMKDKLEKSRQSESIARHLIEEGPDKVSKYIDMVNGIHEDTRKLARYLEEVKGYAKKQKERDEEEKDAA